MKIEFSKEEVEFIKNLKGAWWSAKYKNWIASSRENNIKALQERYFVWDDEQFEKLIANAKAAFDPFVVEIYRTPQYPEKFIVSIKGYRADVDFIKKIPYREYEQEGKKWIIPLDQNLLVRIIEHYSNAGAKVINRMPEGAGKYLGAKNNLKDRTAKLLSKYQTKHQAVLQKYTDTLIRQRYSYNTIKGYLDGFAKYVYFQGENDIEKSTVNEVNGYITMLGKSKCTESVLHRAINAIKFYYQKVIFIPDFKLDQIKRPRHGVSLPRILSMEEVDRIMRATENIKHVAILYDIYGGGIRLGEILNLRVDDILWERNQIFIKSGKGKKER